MVSGAKHKLWLLLAILAILLIPAKCQDKTQAQDKAAEQENSGNKDKKEQGKKQKKPKNKKDDVDEIGNRNVGKGVNFYSLEKEIALGKQLAQEIEKQVKLIDDPVISEYVNRVGQNLVRNSDSKVPFTIKVIDTDEPNALSLPGGFFFVNSGLVLLAENESQMAGVMAHEIAHVTARHGTRQATRGQVINLATIPLIFMGGWTGYGIRQAAGLAIPLGFLQFSRAFEREADSLGLQYLYKAGYDPNEFVEFFEKLEKLEKKKPGTLAKVFGTHPMTEDRVKAAQKEIQEVLPPKDDYVVNTSEFMDVKARLISIYSHVKRTDKDKKDDGRPTLRNKTGNDKIEPQDKDKKSKDKEDEDDRPTLKRR